MKLADLVGRAPPEPWGDADKIPWHEPAFSARMLREHLDQRHDAASRRRERIERQVAWIHEHVCRGEPARVLDLGCGPGLYTAALARRGHECTGIDFSPASIAYARDQARSEELPCEYRLADVRDGGFGEGFELVLLLHGELNAFRPEEAQALLARARAACSGGSLVLEPHEFAAVEARGRAAPSWYATESGVFGDEPHLVLRESAWHEERAAAAIRYWVLHEDGALQRYGETLQAYGEDDYDALLAQAGFADASRYPALDPGGRPDEGLFVLVAESR